MNQIYFKNLFYGSVVCALIFQSGNLSAQRTKHNQNDRHDLIANINKVHLDNRRISNLKESIAASKDSGNRKDIKSQRQKLVHEKKVLKVDYSNAREQASTYSINKKKKIKTLKAELKASNKHYEAIRKRAKKNLSKKNDFALQKDAAELLKAVQVRNETSTQLSMEKSDLLATEEAVEAAWKKVKDGRNPLPANPEKKSSEPLTNK